MIIKIELTKTHSMKIDNAYFILIRFYKSVDVLRLYSYDYMNLIKNVNCMSIVYLC